MDFGAGRSEPWLDENMTVSYMPKPSRNRSGNGSSTRNRSIEKEKARNLQGKMVNTASKMFFTEFVE